MIDQLKNIIASVQEANFTEVFERWEKFHFPFKSTYIVKLLDQINKQFEAESSAHEGQETGRH